VVIVLAGNAETAATPIGRALAAELGWAFVEGGRATELHAVAARAVDRREHTVVACPALTPQGRDMLRGDLRTVRFVHLQTRGDALVEAPSTDEALTVDAAWPPERILGAIRSEFGV
jgi:gluconate kinase